MSVGTCFGKFTKTTKFRLHITALDFLAPYAKVTMGASHLSYLCLCCHHLHPLLSPLLVSVGVGSRDAHIFYLSDITFNICWHRTCLQDVILEDATLQLYILVSTDIIFVGNYFQICNTPLIRQFVLDRGQSLLLIFFFYQQWESIYRWYLPLMFLEAIWPKNISITVGLLYSTQFGLV